MARLSIVLAVVMCAVDARAADVSIRKVEAIEGPSTS